MTEDLKSGPPARVWVTNYDSAWGPYLLGAELKPWDDDYAAPITEYARNTEYVCVELYNDAFALGQAAMRGRAAEKVRPSVSRGEEGRPAAFEVVDDVLESRFLSIRALPITGSPLAAALRLPEVKALVEAVEHERNMVCQDIGMQLDASKAVDAALAAIKEEAYD